MAVSAAHRDSCRAVRTSRGACLPGPQPGLSVLPVCTGPVLGKAQGRAQVEACQQKTQHKLAGPGHEPGSIAQHRLCGSFCPSDNTALCGALLLGQRRRGSTVTASALCGFHSRRRDSLNNPHPTPPCTPRPVLPFSKEPHHEVSPGPGFLLLTGLPASCEGHM